MGGLGVGTYCLGLGGVCGRVCREGTVFIKFLLMYFINNNLQSRALRLHAMRLVVSSSHPLLINHYLHNLDIDHSILGLFFCGLRFLRECVIRDNSLS